MGRGTSLVFGFDCHPWANLFSPMRVYDGLKDGISLAIFFEFNVEVEFHRVFPE